MKRKKFDFFAVLGVIIAIIGIAFPILWDYYKTKSAVELQLTSFSTLVEKTDQLDKLTITYNGENLNLVSKADFVLINTGRVPIVEQDLVSPPQIIFGNNIKILDVKVDSSQPKNLAAVVTTDLQNNSVTITFPLLNPNDYIHFSVLVDSKTINFDATARIVGIAELSVTDKTLETSKVTRAIPWTVYPVGIVSVLLLLLALIGGLPQALHESKVKKQIANNQFILPENSTPATYIDIIISILDFTLKSKRDALIDSLKKLPQDVPIINDDYKILHNKILALIQSSSNIAGVVVIVMLSLVGIWYVIVQIW